MRSLLLSASALALAVCAAAPLSAQLASEIAVRHRDGQTFVTWREAATTGVRYRVYRAPLPIAGATELGQADFLGEVDDQSSFNRERSTAERGPRNWVIAAGAPALASIQGLFVHTVGDDAQAFYAVTSVRGGVESRTVRLGRNATATGIEERAAPPQPVLQAASAVREVWAHWVGNRDTPHQPALSLLPSHGFDFCHEPGTASGARGLLVRLHAAGGNYALDWPARSLVPLDVDILGLSDLYPTTGYTSWLGAHEDFPAAPGADARVWNFTQQRLLWTLDWLAARLGAAHDEERVCVAGSSLGGTGGMYLIQEAPERFSAALLRNGNFDLRAGDLADVGPYERLLGAFELDLSMRSGLPALQRTRARFMASLAPTVDWPVVRTINGRQDTRVGWASAVDLFAGLAETSRPSVHYFDDRQHSPTGYWSPLERALLRRTCQVRRDRPSLRFGQCTLDDDAGDGTRTSGTTIGTLNGRVDFDPLTASATALALRFEVYLRRENALDDARTASGFAVLTPRRTGPFTPFPGELVRFTLREGTTLVDEHWLTADELGLVHTPPVPLARTRRTASFERQAAPLGAALSGILLGAAPLPGDELQVLVHGRAGERWQLALHLGSAAGPLTVADPGCRGWTSGRCDAFGHGDVRAALSPEVSPGTWIWARARVGGAWTAWSTAVVQEGTGRHPRSTARRAFDLAR